MKPSQALGKITLHWTICFCSNVSLVYSSGTKENCFVYSLNETQADFRKDYSTLNHIFLLKCVTGICKWKKRKFCLFVDYKKAFHIVWREGLWWKVIRDYVNVKLLKVIHSMYSNTKAICNGKSRTFWQRLCATCGWDREKVYRHCYSFFTLMICKKNPLNTTAII